MNKTPEWFEGRRDLLIYLIGVACKTEGAEVWRALFAEQLEITRVQAIISEELERLGARQS